MPVVEWTPKGLADLNRLEAFLHEKSQRAADDAVNAIIAAIYDLVEFPKKGRPLSVLKPDFRELVVKFSDGGYVVLYFFAGETIEIQGIRHQREAGY